MLSCTSKHDRNQYAGEILRHQRFIIFQLWITVSDEALKLYQELDKRAQHPQFWTIFSASVQKAGTVTVSDEPPSKVSRRTSIDHSYCSSSNSAGEQSDSRSVANSSVGCPTSPTKHRLRVQICWLRKKAAQITKLVGGENITRANRNVSQNNFHQLQQSWPHSWNGSCCWTSRTNALTAIVVLIVNLHVVVLL